MKTTRRKQPAGIGGKTPDSRRARPGAPDQNPEHTQKKRRGKMYWKFASKRMAESMEMD
ncbi:MAG: hypothetical protein QGI35_02150 [Arenicellales bacterium]|nr:hypothetical protein [Arenicellales bacterium]MDP6391759.1 hypothetical protein [Arenicellales bacterium]MDP7220054.1 hypothetical protein [Arenicellales bacterium]HJP10258.1 hypothetical protein [Arenicellales bacterium]